MARNPKLRIEIDAQDKASKVIDDVADKADKLDTMDAEVEVTADDQASDELADIRDKLERLDKDEAKVLLRAETKDARADLRAAQRELINLDDEEAEVEVKAEIAQAKARLDAIQDEAEQLDRMDPDVDVSVTGGDELGDLLDNVPGPMGDLVGGFSKLGPGGLIAGAGAGMFALAQSQSDAAIDAQTFADLTGTTVEHASAMLAVFQRADIELGDAADIALQLNGTLRDNPEYARQLGINLDDGLNPAQRLVQVIDLMGTNTLNASDAADLFASAFGEEGVRQAGRLNTVVGDVGQAIEDIPDANVFSDADVANAREFESAMSQLKLQVQGVAAGLAQDVIPAMGTLAEGLGLLQEQEQNLNDTADGGGFFGTLYDSARRSVDPVYAARRAIEDAGDAAEDTEGYTGALADGFGDTAAASTDLESSAQGVQSQMDLTSDALGGTEGHLAAVEAAADEAAATSERFADASARVAEAAEEEAEALDAAREAADEKAEANRRAVDAGYDLAETTWETSDALAEERENLDAAEEGSREYYQALINSVRASQAQADATEEVARQHAAKRGITLSDADATRVNNKALLDQVSTLNGPQRQALINHIGQINNIPDDVMTDIQAAIDRGDLITAQSLINGVANKNYSAHISVSANTWAAENALNWAARGRTANISSRKIGGHWARGTTYAPGGMSVVGEEGPEVVDLPMGASVTDAQASKGKMARMGDRGGGSRPTVVNNIVQNFPAGTRPADVAHSTRKYTRIQGPL